MVSGVIVRSVSVSHVNVGCVCVNGIMICGECFGLWSVLWFSLSSLVVVFDVMIGGVNARIVSVSVVRVSGVSVTGVSVTGVMVCDCCR